MVRTYSIVDKKLVEEQDRRGNILAYICPTEEERKELTGVHHVDEHTLASALDPDEPARLEHEPDHTAFIFKSPKNYSANDRFLFKVASIGFFVYRERMILVLSEDVPLFKGKPFVSIESIEEVFLKVLLGRVHHYLEHLKVINQISDEIEGLIGASMENKYLLNLFSLEKSLVYYQSAINSNGYALERLKLAAPKLNFGQAAVDLLDHVMVENTQCYRQAEIHSNILASLMDARVSIVGNNLNMLMKTLNLVTIFIMVPTFVVSAFSMNIDIPFEGHPRAFWIVLGLATLSVVLFMLWWNVWSAKLSRNGGFGGPKTGPK